MFAISQNEQNSNYTQVIHVNRNYYINVDYTIIKCNLNCKQ